MKRTDENHSFNIHVCQILGNHPQKAILLKEIYGWIMINLKKKHNLKHGLIWTYMSAQQFSEKFPYMASKSIDRWLRQLQADGWLYVGNFNEKLYDKTKWYTINWKRYDLAVLGQEQILAHSEEWIAQIEECIGQNEETVAQIEEWMYHIEEPIPSPTQLQNQNKDIEELRERNKDLSKKLEDALKSIEQMKQEPEKPKKKNPKFMPPTLEQVQQYCTEKGMIERYAQVFLDYNENRDWKLKNNKKMKSWKAAFRNSMEYDWNQKYKLAEGEQPPEQDAHTLPEDKEKAYLKRVADIHKRTGGRISYFTRAEFASWLKGGHNFEKWRDRGWLETAITGKITKTINYLATSTFAQQLRGRLSDYVESAFAGNIKEL